VRRGVRGVDYKLRDINSYDLCSLLNITKKMGWACSSNGVDVDAWKSCSAMR
jgi:hypothetical protein